MDARQRIELRMSTLRRTVNEQLGSDIETRSESYESDLGEVDQRTAQPRNRAAGRDRGSRPRAADAPRRAGGPRAAVDAEPVEPRQYLRERARTSKHRWRRTRTAAALRPRGERRPAGAAAARDSRRDTRSGQRRTGPTAHCPDGIPSERRVVPWRRYADCWRWRARLPRADRRGLSSDASGEHRDQPDGGHRRVLCGRAEPGQIADGVPVQPRGPRTVRRYGQRTSREPQ